MILPSPSESIPIIEGPYGASRRAWLVARLETVAALGKIRTAVAKVKDPRAAQISIALDRVIRRIPDAGSALEALADAEESGAPTAALKENARKTAQLASYYLRSDRLLAMVRENPFTPVSVDKIFSPALQTLQRELK